MPTRPARNRRIVSCSPPLASFSAIAAPTRHLTRVSWTGWRARPLSSGTNATRDTHGDGATFNRSGSTRSARNGSLPAYDTDPQPAVPSLNDEPGCIKVVDTFRVVTRLRSSRSPDQTARQLPEQSTTLRVDPPPLVKRAIGAHYKTQDICNARGPLIQLRFFDA